MVALLHSGSILTNNSTSVRSRELSPRPEFPTHGHGMRLGVYALADGETALACLHRELREELGPGGGGRQPRRAVDLFVDGALVPRARLERGAPFLPRQTGTLDIARSADCLVF